MTLSLTFLKFSIIQFKFSVKVATCYNGQLANSLKYQGRQHVYDLEPYQRTDISTKPLGPPKIKNVQKNGRNAYHPLVVILKCRTNWQNPLTTLSWKDSVSQYSEVLSEAAIHLVHMRGAYLHFLVAQIRHVMTLSSLQRQALNRSSITM